MNSNNNRTTFVTVLVARETSQAPTGECTECVAIFIKYQTFNMYSLLSVSFKATKFNHSTATNDDHLTFIELEIKLRRCSQKLRVVPSLNGGAQILFPVAGTTVAVRVYDTVTISKLEKEYSNDNRDKIRNQINTILQNDTQHHNDMGQSSNANKDDFHGICAFRDSFKHPIVFFILTPDLISDQLGRVDSVVNTLQRCLLISNKNENDKPGKKVRSMLQPAKYIIIIYPFIKELTFHYFDTHVIERKCSYFRSSRHRFCSSNYRNYIKLSNERKMCIKRKILCE